MSGRPGAITVTGLAGRRLGSLTPLDGQYLKWNGTSQQWEPTTLAVAMSVFGRTGAVSAQTGDYTFDQIAGTVGTSQLPAAGGDVSGTLTGATRGANPKPAGIGDNAADRAGDGVGWSTMDPADGRGREWRASSAALVR